MYIYNEFLINTNLPPKLYYFTNFTPNKSKVVHAWFNLMFILENQADRQIMDVNCYLCAGQRLQTSVIGAGFEI